jgi:transmembrane sensor
MNQSIHDTAAHWQIKMANEALTSSEEAALERWLAQDPAHRLALAQAGIAWYGVALAHAEKTKKNKDELFSSNQKHRSSSWKIRVAGISTGVLLACLHFVMPGWWAFLQSDLHTQVGEVHNHVLSDGSQVTLDSDSAIAIDYSGAQRRIRLLRGAAYFDVKPNAERPFVVAVGDITARALGTAYVVDATTYHPQISVTHGVVGVDQESYGNMATLTQGQRASVNPYAHQVRMESDNKTTFRASAWVQGILSFDSITLGHALEQLDRYVPEKIMLFNEKASTQPVTAVFPVKDAQMAIDALARSHNLSVSRWPGLIILGSIDAK